MMVWVVDMMSLVWLMVVVFGTASGTPGQKGKGPPWEPGEEFAMAACDVRSALGHVGRPEGKWWIKMNSCTDVQFS